VEERERTCDEEVLATGSERRIYAESILKTCEFCVESPLACVSGVTSADLRKRIVRIMSERKAQELSLGKKFLLSAFGAATVAGPLVFGRVVTPRKEFPQGISAGAPHIDVRPFVMEQVDFVVLDGSIEKITRRDIVSRRRDGAISEMSTGYGQTGPNEVTNTIRFPGGLKVWTYELVRAKSTTMQPNAWIASNMAMLLNPPGRCVSGGDTLDGEEHMFGYLADRTISEEADHLSRWVVWSLPAFNCTRVQAFIQKRTDTSSKDWRTVQGLQTLRFGETDPDPSVFTDWKGYQEMKPSDMLAAFLVARGTSREEAHQVAVRDSAREDREYAERHPR
jgi:hypothetical protein